MACGLAAVAGLLGSCASEQQPRGPAPRAEAAPPPAAGSGLETEAMAFESFMRRGRAIDPAFSDPDDVSRAMRTGAGHDPRQLEAGMVAYAALAALQEPGFVSGLRRDGGRETLARRIAGDPAAALDLPGASAAAGRASAALLREGQGLAQTGAEVRQAAYQVQRQSWSKARIAEPARRLAQVKQISAAGYRAEPGDAARLRSAFAEAGRRGGAASPLVTRAVAVAALEALGEGARGHGLMHDPSAGMCLKMAKLNLYQCLASAGPQYEDIYCLGVHALSEPAHCVNDAARARPQAIRASYRY